MSRKIILIKQELLLLVYELNRSGLLAENEKIRPILAQLEKLLLCDLSPSTNDSRSEERFSRNAETDLVCRLLLEKKNEVYLGLDGGPGCAGVPSVVGDPTAKYEIGATIQTTLHFQRYTINGDPAASAPAPHCPLPSTLRVIGTVLDAGSLYAVRRLLAYNGPPS